MPAVAPVDQLRAELLATRLEVLAAGIIRLAQKSLNGDPIPRVVQDSLGAWADCLQAMTPLDGADRWRQIALIRKVGQLVEES